MAVALFSEHFQVENSSGVPLAGCLLYFYSPGTTTPVTTYQDSGLGTPSTTVLQTDGSSAIVADATGTFAPIYVTTSPFKFVLKSAALATIQTVDPAYVPLTSGNTTPILFGDGSVSLPGIAFTNDPDTGIYRIGANEIGFAVGGVKIVDVSGSGVAITGTLSTTGAITTTGTVSLNNTAAGTILTLTSADAGATSGPNQELFRDSASPATNDILSILYWYGRDSAANKQEYASTQVTIVDPVSTSEDAVSEDYVTVGGARTAFIRRGALASGTADPNNVGLPKGQLSFPATQNPSSDTNTLDDYEEGAWTPAFSATGCTFSYAVQNGTYVKIGKLVHIFAQLQLNTSGNTLAGNPLSVTGQPFNGPGGEKLMVSWFAATSSYVNVQASFSGLSFSLLGATAAATASTAGLNANALLHATNGSSIIFSGTYIASA